MHTSAASYSDSCTKYKTSILVTTNKSTPLWSLPCSSSTDSSSTVIATAEAGETLTVVAMYKNDQNHYWYKIAGQSSTCYAYCGNTTFSSYNKSGDLSTDDMTVTWKQGRPRVIQVGKSFTVDGKVLSKYSTMTQVATYVYSGAGVLSGTPVRSAVCSGLSTTSFDIKSNKTNTSLKFENITAEGMYTYSIKAKVTYRYSNDGTTMVEKTSGEQDVYHCTFRTVKKSSTPTVTETVAKERLNNLISKLADGKHYFTKAGTSPCTTPAESNHGCAGCDMTKVICKDWLLNLLDWKIPVYSIQGSITHYVDSGSDTNGQSCSGFANYAGWYIFAEDAGNKVTFEKHYQGKMTYDTMKHAKAGDIMRSSTMGHSMIFVKASSSNFTVLDCNYGSATYGQCIIRKHTISYNSDYNITISRATNYDIPTYSVKYNANGGSGAPSAQTKYKDEPLTLSKTVPTRENYTFLGWSSSATATKAEYAAGASYTKNADVTLYAVWKLINPFTDVVEGEYYYDPVLWAYYNNPQITNGTSDTTFGPEKTVTRGQAVTFLWRAANCPEPTVTDHPFTDVKESAFYYTAMLWAVEKGITNGTSATTFGPNKTCTIEQILAFIYRYVGEPAIVNTENPWSDVNGEGFGFRAIMWAVENGIAAPKSGTVFGRKDDCTRAAIVSYLYRIVTGKGLLNQN